MAVHPRSAANTGRLAFGGWLPPAGGTVWVFPRKNHAAPGYGADGPLFKVARIDGSHWRGLMVGRAPAATAFEWPNCDRFMLINRPYGACITYEAPQNFEDVKPAFFIEGFVATPDGRSVIVHDWTWAACYSDARLVWTTERLALDGLGVERIDSDQVVFSRDDIGDERSQITLDVRTGKVLSGKPFRWN